MVNFQEFMDKIIESLSKMKVFNEEELASDLGVGREEAHVMFRQYVLENGLLPRPSINMAALGLKEIRVFMEFSCDLIDAIPMILSSLRQRGFLVSYYRVLHACHYVTRHAVPRDVVKPYLDFLEEMKALGWLRGYEVREMDATYRFSPSPYVLDYNRGEWGVNPSAFLERRKLPSFRSEPFPELDSIDLRVLINMKRHPLQKKEELASSLGLTVEQLEEHITAHIVAGDLVKGWYIDFGPGFADNEMLLLGTYYEKEDGDQLLDEILRHPYLIFLSTGRRWVETLNAVPNYRITRVLDMVESTMRKGKARDLMVYLSPVYDLNTLAGEERSTFFQNNFQENRWVFHQDVLEESVRADVRLGRGSGGGELALAVGCLHRQECLLG
ncbi:hypothetical protein PQ610_00890 [Tardisphaera miroshnichenkoae]